MSMIAASLTRATAARTAAAAGLTTRPLLMGSRPWTQGRPGTRQRETQTPGTRRQLHQESGQIGKAVSWTAQHLTMVHEWTNMPWMLEILATAALLGLLIRLPVSLYTMRLVRRRAEVEPLVVAWAKRHAQNLPLGAGNDGTLKWQQRVGHLTKQSRLAIYRSFGVQGWKSTVAILPIMPFWILSQALYRLSGMPGTWMMSLLGATEWGVADPLADATLKTGGLLWFQDLSVMDPYYVWPLACSLVLALRHWTKFSREEVAALLRTGDEMNPGRARQMSGSLMSRMTARAMIATPLMPLVFSHLPCAMMVYWFANFTITDWITHRMAKRTIKKALEIKTGSKSTEAEYLRRSRGGSS